MTNRASKFFLPVGVSVLALIAFQATAIAQEMDIPAPELEVTAPEPEIAAPDLMMDEDTSVPVLVLPEDEEADDHQADDETASGEREISEEVDPAIAAELRRLDAMGTLERQARMGEDILIIDREIKRAEAIEKLIGYLGVDGFKLHYPMLAGQLENSPIMLAADLERHKLLGEIEIAKAGPQAPAAPAAPTARDDGSSFFGNGAVPMPETATAEQPPASALLGPDGKFSPEVARLLADEIRKIAAENARIEESAAAAQGRVRGLSLREVYGAGDSIAAALTLQDGEKVHVRVGDKLPDNTTVEAIDLDSITLLRNGTVIKVDLGG